MCNEKTETAVVPEIEVEKTLTGLVQCKMDEEFWQAMRENGVDKKIYDSFCKFLKPLPNIFWNDDKLFKAGKKSVVPVANFLPVPTEEILYDDGKEQQRYFRMIGRKSNDFTISELSEIMIKATDTGNMNWIMDKWGFGANIFPPYQSNKDTLRSVMVTIGEQTAVRKTIFTHTGWRKIDDKWCFLHAGGAIGAEDVEVRLEGNLDRYRFPETTGDVIERNNAFRSVFGSADKKMILPFIAQVFLTPLNEFLRQAGHEPSFVLNYVGRTQSRKSTLAALMLSFFGSFTAASLPANFKDTANALEKKGYILKDMLMIVDDYHPAATMKERRTMEQTMQSLSRMYGDRRARDRLNTEIALRSGNIPRGNVAVTGEDIASIGQSGIARNFIVEMQPDSVPVNDTLNASQAYAENGILAAFMRGYIEWLIPQADDLPNRLKAVFENYRGRAIAEKICGLGRAGDTVAWLMTGLHILSDYLYFCGINDIDLSDSWQILKEIAESQLGKNEETTPTKMFLDAVGQLFDSGKIYTENIGEIPKVEQLSGAKVGYSDNELYYFIPDTIYAEVGKYYSSQGKIFPVTCPRLMKHLASEKLCIANGERNTFQKRIGNRRHRYLCIPKRFIDDECLAA
ncbi:MAG: DUF927 domain-containing protein [Ruminiclostridium sp.]|nr:DUF927 domain-containing protein [Ruminiclostridium sp.]